MLATPQEIRKKFPGIAKFWTVQDIGYLLRLRIVAGKKLSHGCIVDEHEVVRVYNLIKNK